jgi:hypothetical protein
MLFHQEAKHVDGLGGLKTGSVFILILTDEDTNDIQEIGEGMTFVVTDLGQEHVHKRLHPSVIPLVPNGPEERG